MGEKDISVVTVGDPQNRGIVSKNPDSSSLIYRDLPIEKLKENINDFTNKISEVLDGIQGKLKNYKLDEIELNVELSASGSIHLIGSVEVGTTGAITLTFKRCSHE